jgi:hypothetical protein
LDRLATANAGLYDEVKSAFTARRKEIKHEHEGA